MKLFFRKLGTGNPLIILHGLFGMSDNWLTFGKRLAENGFAVYLVDLRNHGNSPHSNEFNYALLSNDVRDLINDENILDPAIIGHSLGGKTAMQLVLSHPEKIKSLIVVDIAPRYYKPHHQEIINALFSVDLNIVQSRSDAEKILTNLIADIATRQFLLKNLIWKESNKLDWKFNLEAISENIENVGEEITNNNSFSNLTLFIKGEKSNYINDDDETAIKKLFPMSKIVTAPGAGHWVHAEKPDWLLENVVAFLKK